MTVDRPTVASRRNAISWRVGTAGLAFVGIAGCRQVLGIDDRTLPAQTACGIELSGACQSCAQAACCDQAAACATSAVCKGLEDCYGNCQGDAGCRAQCTVDHPAGDGVLVGQLEACLAGQCETACTLACGALSHVAPPDDAQSCQACLQQISCDVARACGTDPQCQGYLHCRESCLTGDCIGACPAQGSATTEFCYGATCGNTDCVRPCSADHDSAQTLYGNFYRDVAGNCQTQCQAGQNWTCLGHVTWPTAKAATRKLAVGFTDLIDPTNKQGISVKMCTNVDPDCASPVSQAVTDENGLVHLTDTTASGNGAGNGLNGYLALSSALLFPTRIYWGFPLSEANGALGTPIPVFEASGWISLVSSLDPSSGFDPAMGSIAAIVLDCAGHQAPNVMLSLSGPDQPNSRAYFIDNVLPNQDSSHTGNMGTGFFINVKPGSVTVTATPVGQTDPESIITVPVLAGVLTEISLAPTPTR